MYKIGSYNLQNFSPPNEQDENCKNMRKAKHFIRIMEEEKFDILALQEVFKKDSVEYLVKELNKKMGNTYSGVHSKDFLDFKPKCMRGDKEYEEYAFIWNSRRIYLIPPQTEMDVVQNKKTQELPQKYYREIYQKLNSPWEGFLQKLAELIDEAIRKITKKDVANEALIKTLKTWVSLKRPPLICGFRPTANLWWELRIINTHIRFGGRNEKTKTRVPKKIAIKLRIEEYKFLTGSIHTLVNTLRFGDYRSVRTLIAGDYNLTEEDLAGVTPDSDREYMKNCENHRVETVQNMKSTLKKITYFDERPRPTSDDEFYSENYDHFSFNQNWASSLKNPGRIECFSGLEKFKEYHEECSDHVPIIAELSL
ncbi:hypothetical protein PDESU_04405 [Pontiella desulfatans]|uniref:Endonuclease/exonuclease/phosphatase domain-containing protein n=1 Tax=Pontiella desulfatans TaxID=2750659 RepID=A0A6C2U6W6_PONDE|nr:hypothetical protein [Pontiella desulfatans]VGO15818.1 hypothetical protein PDESU_04405 [Pontiella desulfatans]